jgi:hypothetical protein
LSLTVVFKQTKKWRMGSGCTAAIVSGYKNVVDLEEGSSSSSLTFFFYTQKVENGEWVESGCTAAIYMRRSTHPQKKWRMENGFPSRTFFFLHKKCGEWRMGSWCTAAIVSGYDTRSRTIMYGREMTKVETLTPLGLLPVTKVTIRDVRPGPCLVFHEPET